MYPCQCVDCSQATLRQRESDLEAHAIEARHLAAFGYGRCELELLPLRFLPMLSIRECNKFEPADIAVTEERRNWLADLGGRSS